LRLQFWRDVVIMFLVWIRQSVRLLASQYSVMPTS